MIRILTINGGSSSIKFALYQAGEALERILYGNIDRIGLGGTSLTFYASTSQEPSRRNLAASDHKSAAGALLAWLEERYDVASIAAVGHRVVHGMKHTQPEIVTRELRLFVKVRAEFMRRSSGGMLAWHPAQRSA